MRLEESDQHHVQSEDGVVEREYSKRTAEVKPLERNVSCGRLLTQENSRNQKPLITKNSETPSVPRERMPEYTSPAAWCQTTATIERQRNPSNSGK